MNDLDRLTAGESEIELAEKLVAIAEKLERIEVALASLAAQKVVKELYTIAEVSLLLGRAAFTVREWCRNNRVRAEKRRTGRGNHRDWVIRHEELERIQNHGLLPLKD